MALGEEGTLDTLDILANMQQYSQILEMWKPLKTYLSSIHSPPRNNTSIH